jgi:hypothetical protein
VPAQYSFNVLQCNPGTFCCRASYDKTNCCNDTSAIIETSHIGTLLLPSGAEVNTTYSPPSNSSSNTAKATCSTAAVGGALSAVLGAVLIGAAVALFFSLNKRKAIQKSLAEVQGQRDAAIEQIEQVKQVKQVKQQPKMDYFTPPDQASQQSYGAKYGHQWPQEMDVGQYSELSSETPERELSTERN